MLVAMLFLLYMTAGAQQVWDVYGEPEKGITVTGIVKGEGGASSAGSVKIYRDGKFYQEVFPGSTGKYEADLPFDSDYELEFSIPGCVTKRIKVETNLPADAKNEVQEPLAFNMSLPKATNGPLDEAYQTAVSRLFFDKSLGDFTRDMVAEEAFRNTLKAKQGEQKRWLEEQKAKEEEEKRKLREEELAKKKAEEAERLAAEAAARQKAEAEARAKAEADAKKAAEAAVAEREKRDAEAKAQADALAQKYKDEELRKLTELQRKREADSLYRETERLRNEKNAATKAEAERLKLEAETKALNEQALKKAQAEEAERMRKQMSDSLYRENERIKKEAEAAAEAELRKRQQAADSAYQSPSTGGSGKSVFYQIGAETAKIKDESALERALNWQRKKEERRQAYLARIERRKAEGERLAQYDTKRERDFMERRAAIEQRRKEFAEKQRLKEEEAERLRKARFQESKDKKIVVLVAYSIANNPNAKYYGYVNFGDGKGPLELTESEYKELAARFKGIYNKQ